jgi:hypothetical protein
MTDIETASGTSCVANIAQAVHRVRCNVVTINQPLWTPFREYWFLSNPLKFIINYFTAPLLVTTNCRWLEATFHRADPGQIVRWSMWWHSGVVGQISLRVIWFSLTSHHITLHIHLWQSVLWAIGPIGWPLCWLPLLLWPSFWRVPKVKKLYVTQGENKSRNTQRLKRLGRTGA